MKFSVCRVYRGLYIIFCLLFFHFYAIVLLFCHYAHELFKKHAKISIVLYAYYESVIHENTRLVKKEQNKQHKNEQEKLCEEFQAWLNFVMFFYLFTLTLTQTFTFANHKNLLWLHRLWLFVVTKC